MSEESAQEFLVRLRDEPEFEKEAQRQGREGKIIDWIRSQGYYFSEVEFVKAQENVAGAGDQAEEESEPAEETASSGPEEEKPPAGSETEEPSQNSDEEEAPPG